MDIETRHYPQASSIDIAEREYRQRFRPHYQNSDSVCVEQYTVDRDWDQNNCQPNVTSSETVERSQFSPNTAKMGYYDDDGKYRGKAL